MIVACMNGIQSFPWLHSQQTWMSDVVADRLRMLAGELPRWTLHYGKGGLSPLPDAEILAKVKAEAGTGQSLLCIGYSYGGNDIVKNVLHPLLKEGRKAGDWKWVGCVTVDADWIKLPAFWLPKALLLPVGVDYADSYRNDHSFPGRAYLVNPGGHARNTVLDRETHNTIPTSAPVRQALTDALYIAAQKEAS